MFLDHDAWNPRNNLLCILAPRLGPGPGQEPESQGAIALAAREKLDNLIFVVNCNLQRLDGPVRGNGKIIQELEGNFRGAGWNVIKVVWGAGWDELATDFWMLALFASVLLPLAVWAFRYAVDRARRDGTLAHY